jgi:signal transduction histidine kinase/ActR/RegA family two-component response regulator
MAAATPPAADRVLVMMPTVRDSERTIQLLHEANVPGVVCAQMGELCRELRAGAGAVLVTDEAITSDTTGQLPEALRSQPEWSALPVIVLAREGWSRNGEATASEVFTSLITVERPVRTRTLISVVLSALRGRRHQYQIRDAILMREQQAAALLQSEAELARQAEELRRADRRKDEFLATLAHELRNPLAPIRTGMDFLARSPDSPARDVTLGVMNRQLSHMVRLIDDLLDVSRITRGKLQLKRERVNLATFIGAALEASRPLIERKQHTLRVAAEDTSLWFDADVTRLAQVISNLLNNASNYTPAGGVIELTAKRDGTFALIEVRDNGIGIPAEHLDDVFEMFSQVNRTLERSQGGLGIGLALVRSLIEMHGGQVSASSAGASQGSTFSVRLPLAAHERVSDDGAPSRSSEHPGAKKRILVVDDNEDAADLLTLSLEHAGYVVKTAYDGPSALSVVEAFQPDLAILDIGLPGMTGYDLARHLRQNTRLPPLALVALTGWGSHEDKQKATDAGFDLHLTKPVDTTDLQRALAKLDPANASNASRSHASL